MAQPRKTVLITGCSPGGIGHSLAICFHEAGLRVFATARTTDVLQDLAELGIETFALDVTSVDDIRRIRQTVSDLTGGSLNMLVNNAGKNCTVPAIDISDEDLLSAFETNVFSVIRLTRELAPLLIQAKGRIVNIGSVAAIIPYPFSPIYNATKAALHAYSNTLRLELEPFGVKVTVIITGGVQSRIARTKRKLIEGSVYTPIASAYERRISHSQEGAMPNMAYAASVVKAVLKKSPPKWFWQGNRAWIIWFLDRFFPRSVWNWIFPRMFGLDKLKVQ
ncbi:hypothetical protein VTO42DRAFT_2287 [Malbranchea cinnamomea]